MRTSASVAVGGCICGVALGVVVAFYFIKVLRPLFISSPQMSFTFGSIASIIGAVFIATALTSLAGSSLVNRLKATELLRDE